MQVIILHGLYMHSIVMHPLRQQLSKMGYQTTTISYNTVAINEEKLFHQIDSALSKDHTHVLVGHSLGGLMIKRYLASRQPDARLISHVVTIGSPLQGASIVSRIEQLGLGIILGNAVEHGLKKHQDKWNYPQKLGSIAGSVPIGMRTLLMGNHSESDGTVTVEETKIEGMTDHITTRTTHTSMLYNQYIAQQIDYFIRYDEFRH